MRPFFLAIVSAASISVLTGCAAGLRAESVLPLMAMTAPSGSIRVRILYSKLPSRLDASGPFLYQLKKGGEIYTSRTSLRVRAMRRNLVFDQRTFKGDMVVVPVSSTDTLKLNGRRYRGNLVFHAIGNGRYDVVEFIGLENYLYGVLPREVGTDWPLESLKAQAVVSRTYVMANRATDPAQRFDVFNEVKSQMYGGLEDEAAPANQAVDLTRGEILQDSRGNPVQAFFHSSCGGYTETPENVWYKPEPSDVFESIKDDFCGQDPYAHWQVELKKSTIVSRLRKAGYKKIGDIKTIAAGKKSSSGRAVTFLVTSSKGKTEIQGNRFRLAMGPEVIRSTLLTSITASEKTVRFEGQGWGLGVGLCQWGARGRALAGQKYDAILKAYYPRAVLKKAPEAPR